MIVTEKFDNFLLVTFDESGKTIIFLASKKLTTGLFEYAKQKSCILYAAIEFS